MNREFKDQIPPEGGRKYRITENPDGTSGISDVTEYQQEGTPFGAKEAMELYDGIVPPGAVIPYAGSSAPDGWLLCDGRTVSRTTYAALFAVIGTAYGAGDGSATFTLPDFRGRTAVGADSDNARGAKEGSKTHAMTEAQNGKHAHQALVSIPKSLAESNIVNGNHTRLAGLKSNAWDDGSVPSYSGMTTGIDYSGSSEPFSIMQPSLYVNYIIKY